MATQAEVKTAAQRLIDLAQAEREAWMRAYRREEKAGHGDRADQCLIGANTIEQLVKKMQRELKVMER